MLNYNEFIKEKFDYTKQIKPTFKNLKDIAKGDYIFVSKPNEKIKKYKIDKIGLFDVISLGKNGYLYRLRIDANDNVVDIKKFDLPICCCEFVDKYNITYYNCVISTSEEILNYYRDEGFDPEITNDFIEFWEKEKENF